VTNEKYILKYRLCDVDIPVMVPHTEIYLSEPPSSILTTCKLVITLYRLGHVYGLTYWLEIGCRLWCSQR